MKPPVDAEDHHGGAFLVLARPPPQNGELVLYRVHSRQLEPPSILLMAPSSTRPTAETLDKIDHEYSLRSELDSMWCDVALRVPLRCSFSMMEGDYYGYDGPTSVGTTRSYTTNFCALHSRQSHISKCAASWQRGKYSMRSRAPYLQGRD